jgi:hypothetical protein
MTFTGSVTSAGGSGNKNSKNENDAGKTPDGWSAGGDVRKDEASGKYPNYKAEHTQSGHNFIMDDSKGAESITLQHRSGTAIQMKPDGQMLITSHNGKYEITFGEDRMTISGARDITVKGDASMRVYGDYNVTCHKNYNLTVMGDLNITAKNKNQLIRGNKDTIAKNETKKFEGSSSVTAGGGLVRVAKGSVTMASQGGKAHFAGAQGLHASVTQKGDMTFDHQGQGNMHMNVAEGFFDGKFSDGSQEVSMVAKEGSLNMKSDKSTKMESKDSTHIKSKQNLQLKSEGGSASLEGTSGTHVGGSSGTTHIIGTTTHVEGSSALNLNSALGQQLDFDFGKLLESIGMPSISNIQAQMSEEEPDADSWTKGLL